MCTSFQRFSVKPLYAPIMLKKRNGINAAAWFYRTSFHSPTLPESSPPEGGEREAALEDARASFGRALDHMTCRDDDPLDLACDCDFHAVLRSIEQIRLASNAARGA